MEKTLMTIAEKVKFIEDAITEECSKHQRPRESVKLVAVSKTKPVPDLEEAYKAGVRVFGENYIQGLEEKYSKLPDDVEWHFIGHLQSNKIKKLLAVKNIVLETVDRETYGRINAYRLATKLNSELEAHHPNRKLEIFVQVLTSEEECRRCLMQQSVESSKTEPWSLCSISFKSAHN